MAIISESPLGVISGKIGQIAGAKWKGINYVRVIPGSVANPQTDEQLTQRQKFSVTMHFLQPLCEFLKTGFKELCSENDRYQCRDVLQHQKCLNGHLPQHRD